MPEGNGKLLLAATLRVAGYRRSRKAWPRGLSLSCDWTTGRESPGNVVSGAYISISVDQPHQSEVNGQHRLVEMNSTAEPVNMMQVFTLQLLA